MIWGRVRLSLSHSSVFSNFVEFLTCSYDRRSSARQSAPRSYKIYFMRLGIHTRNLLAINLWLFGYSRAWYRRWHINFWTQSKSLALQALDFCTLALTWHWISLNTTSTWLELELLDLKQQKCRCFVRCSRAWGYVCLGIWNFTSVSSPGMRSWGWPRCAAAGNVPPTSMVAACVETCLSVSLLIPVAIAAASMWLPTFFLYFVPWCSPVQTSPSR